MNAQPLRAGRLYSDAVQKANDGQTASLSSLEARKATFLLALIWIGSPVAGLRPMRAARLRTTQNAETDETNAVALLEVLGDEIDQVAENGFRLLLRHLVVSGQCGGEVLETDGIHLGLGCGSGLSGHGIETPSEIMPALNTQN